MRDFDGYIGDARKRIEQQREYARHLIPRCPVMPAHLRFEDRRLHCTGVLGHHEAHQVVLSGDPVRVASWFSSDQPQAA